MRSIVILLLVVLYGLAANSHAHTPYLKPFSFDLSGRNTVTLDGSFAEHFFVPEVAFAGSIYKVTTPSGRQVNPDLLNILRSRVVVEHELKDEGTYRFTTGSRLGRVFRTYVLDGKRKRMRDPSKPLPEGAEPLDHFQSLTRAEAYVSKGAPTKTALQPIGKGLEFIARTHPNEVYVGEPFNLRAHYDAAPLSNLKVDVYLGADQFSDEKAKWTLRSDAKGNFSFTPQQPGLYLIMARHRSKAPVSAEAPEYSNTYTLVVEAID